MDDHTRVPEDLDESRNSEDYGARQYNAATAPTTLMGVRGISKNTLIAAIAATVLFAGGGLWTIFSHFHHSDTAVARAAQPHSTAGPAWTGSANGAGGSGLSALDQSNAGFPTTTETAAPYQFASPNPLRTPFSTTHTPTPVAYHPYGPGSGNGNAGSISRTPANGPAATKTAEPSSRMNLESPKNQGGGSAQDAQASQELTDANRPMVYKTVYNADGTVAGVFPVPVYTPVGSMPPGWGGRRAPAQAYEARPPSVGYPQSYPAQQYPPPQQYAPPQQQYAPPQSSAEDSQPSQFASNGNANGSGSGFSGSDDQGAANHEKFVREHTNDNVGYVPDVSEDELVPSTVILARLITKIVTSLPGPVTAEVSSAVYDSKTNSKVVIPVGTKLFGQYENALVHNQNRLLMAFQQLIFPDGRVFAIGGEPAGDAQGTAGFSGDTDYHRGALYTSAFLLTVLGGVEAGLSGGSSCGSALSGVSIGQSIQCGAGNQISSLGNKVIDRELDRTPTIIIRPPYQFEVTVTRMLPLNQYRTR